MRGAVNHLKKSDPVLAAIIARVGPPRVAQRPATFWALARSIVFQQLNGKAATTIFDRLEQLCRCGDGSSTRPARVEDPGPHDPAPGTDSPFTPDAILALTNEQLRSVGLSKQKASYIRDLAQKTHSGELDFAALPALTDEEIIARLTAIKGIGVWTAQMFLMFALRRPNVMPTADYGIRAAIQKAYRLRQLPTPKQILKLARNWEPYCTVACWYLWRSVDVATIGDGRKRKA